MPADEFKVWHEKKAWEIAKFHFDNNPLYRKKTGDIFPSRWEDLPVITKKDLQQPLALVLTKGIKAKDYYTASTSGSTGQPFFFAKSKMAHAMTWAVIADRYGWYDLNQSSKQARFYGIPKEFPAYQSELLKDSIMNRVRFSVFDLSDKALEGFTEKFRQQSFNYIYGYTSSLVMFARYLLKNGMVLKGVCPTLKVCISTSETCTPEDDKILREGFGVRNVREYGLSETCLTAFDSPAGEWQLTEETLYTETVDANEPEGRILSTSLFNTAFPMVRYETGDMGVIGPARGSIYRNLVQLTGRTNDMIQLPGGKTSPGLSFYYISRSILESGGVLKEFIIRQTAKDRFVFDIVADRELTEHEAGVVKEKISLYLEPGLDIVINKVDHIDRPASGKLKHFYSELN